MITGCNERLTQFEVLVSYRFQKHIQELTQAQVRRGIYECIEDLISSSDRWSNRDVRKPKGVSSKRAIRIARIDDSDSPCIRGADGRRRSFKASTVHSRFCKTR
jgi:hypothetical protein